MKKTFAFSLAETLTTLLIIGAVAAMLIPSLQNNISKQKNLTMLKKLYSSFSVNIKTVLAQGSCASISCLRRYGENNNPDEDKRSLHNGVFADSKYFNILNDCPSCIAKGSAMPPPMKAIYSPTGKVGEASDDKPANFSTYQLVNGAVMAIYDFEGNCVLGGQNNKVSRNRENLPACSIVVFDTNGTKGPNIPGRDRFAYYIMDEPLEDSFLVPIGYSNFHNSINSAYGDKGCTLDDPDKRYGYNCTAKVMIDGWKMEY